MTPLKVKESLAMTRHDFGAKSGARTLCVGPGWVAIHLLAMAHSSITGSGGTPTATPTNESSGRYPLVLISTTYVEILVAAILAILKPWNTLKTCGVASRGFLEPIVRMGMS